MAQLKVDLGLRSYPIFIDTDADLLLDRITPFLKHTNLVIVSNETVAKHYLSSLQSKLNQKHKVDTFLMNDGEQYKSLDTFAELIHFLLAGNYGRDTTLIALGGGVVGDLTGFVAACYQRGVDFVQIPTTLLSQVDSSVGGKTAVNHPLGKNMIGAFYQPKAVMIDVTSLQTLPEREFAAGIAEVIKYGVANDVGLFEYLEANKAEIKKLNTECLKTVIRWCCEIKANIVKQDETEGGVRALLNFGHTFGHAIEAQMGYGNWLHGEAVAAGMVYASQIAQIHGFLTATELDRIKALIAFFDLPVKGPKQMSFEDYMPHMRKDKKTLAGALRFVIPTGIGSSRVMSNISDAQLKQVLGITRSAD